MANEPIMDKNVRIVSGVLSDAGIKHTNEHCLLLIGASIKFQNRGYKVKPKECAEFLVNKKNRKQIKKNGLEKTILAMSKMQLGTIKRESPKIGRNDKCPLNPDIKFKKCCGIKHKNICVKNQTNEG